MKSLTEILQDAAHNNALALAHIDLQDRFYKPETQASFENAAALDTALSPLARKGALQKVWIGYTDYPTRPHKVSDRKCNSLSATLVTENLHDDDILIGKNRPSITSNPNYIPFLSQYGISTLITDGVFRNACYLESTAMTLRASTSPISLLPNLKIIIAYDGVDNIKSPAAFKEKVIDRAGVSKRLARKRLFIASNDEITDALTPVMVM